MNNLHLMAECQTCLNKMCIGYIPEQLEKTAVALGADSALFQIRNRCVTLYR